MGEFATSLNTVVTTTTAAIWTVITTGLPSLWTFQIAVGAVMLVAGAIVGIFAVRRRRRRGRR